MHEPCRVTSTLWLCGRNFKCLPIYSWPQWGGELCKTRIFEWNVNPALHVFWYIFFIVISRAEDQWYIISQFRTIPHPIRHQMRCGIANFDPSYNITIYLWRIVAKAHTCHSHTHTHIPFHRQWRRIHILLFHNHTCVYFGSNGWCLGLCDLRPCRINTISLWRIIVSAISSSGWTRATIALALTTTEKREEKKIGFVLCVSASVINHSSLISNR